MSGIRVELQLKDGSFTTGMLRAGQSVSSFKKELARVDPHFRKMTASGKRMITTVRRADVVNKSFLATMRDVSIVAGAVALAFRGITASGGGIVSSITSVNAQMERLKYQMLGMSVSAKPMREAAASVEFLRQKALEVPFSLGELANSFVKLKATGTDPMAGSLQAVADGIAAFGGTDEQLHRVTLGIVQMSGKSVIQMEEMRQQLGESMPNAMRLMARSMGVSVAELTKAISTGRVESSAALQSFYDELKRTYGGEAQRMMDTFSGQVTQLRANMQLLATSDGMSAFFEEQKAGLMQLNDFMRSADAKKFAKDIGNALAGVVRFIRVAVETLYDLRQEIVMVSKIIAGGMAFALLGKAARGMATSIVFAKLAMGGFATQLASGISMLRLGVTGLFTMQAATTSAGLAWVGMGTAIAGVGGIISVAAPWLAAIGVVVALAAGKMGSMRQETDGAYESLKRYGAESKSQAESILSNQGRALADAYAIANKRLQQALHSRVNNEGDGSRGRKIIAERQAEYDAAVTAFRQFQKDKAKILNDAGAEEISTDIRDYERSLTEKLRLHNEAYRKTQVEIDREQAEELGKTAETNRKVFDITEETQEKTLANRIKRSDAVIGTIDDELERLKELQADTTQEDKAMAIGRMIDMLHGKRMAAAEEARRLGDFGIKFVANIESEEAKFKRGQKILDGLNVKVKGLQAGLAGAGSEFAKLQFMIARGDYGSIRQGGEETRKLHEGLREAVLQKEALDELMKGDKEASADLEAIRRKNLEEELELLIRLENRDMNDAEKFLFGLENGFFKGLGPMGNIKEGVAGVGIAMRDDAFGTGTVDRINTVNEALGNTLSVVSGIASGVSAISFDGMNAGGNRPSGGYARNGGMLDLIASVESNKNRNNGYNSTLDDGKWTGGQKNLVAMTLKQIAVLQKQMLANPENAATYAGGGSSALGRYQIVSKTMRGLIEEMKLTGDELYDENMQDRMAMRLLNRRGNSTVGLRQEWQGLQNVPEDVIQAALKVSNRNGPTRENAARMSSTNSDPLITNRVAETARLRREAKEEIEKAESNRLLREQALRQEQLQKLISAKSGESFKMDGQGKNFAAMIEAIQSGKLGDDRDIGADAYKEILKAAKELDVVEEKRKERSRATKASAKALETLKREELELDRRITEEKARVKNPDYVEQSTDLRKLIEDLDKYVETTRTAFGSDSAEFAAAQARRSTLIGKQTTLDVTTRQAGLAEEARSLRESLMTEGMVRDNQLARDIARIDNWVSDARAAGMEEVEIVRQAEALKAAIRDKHAAETNPVTKQMKEWADFSGNIASKTTGWMDNLAGGVTGLITGTGDLRSAIGGILNDLVNSQVKSLFSNLAGNKAGDAAGLVGGKGKNSPMAPGANVGKTGKAVGVAHAGGIAGGSLRSMRVNPGVFVNAPKFHTGGIVGNSLKRDEVPIIAKKKEGIFTEEQMASLSPVGSGGSPISINAPITVNGSAGTPEQNNDLSKKMAKELEGTMRGVVVDELRRQNRPGNMLNKGR